MATTDYRKCVYLHCNALYILFFLIISWAENLFICARVKLHLTLLERKEERENVQKSMFSSVNKNKLINMRLLITSANLRQQFNVMIMQQQHLLLTAVFLCSAKKLMKKILRILSLFSPNLLLNL
jgi:hypothetical protein